MRRVAGLVLLPLVMTAVAPAWAQSSGESGARSGDSAKGKKKRAIAPKDEAPALAAKPVQVANDDDDPGAAPSKTPEELEKERALDAAKKAEAEGRKDSLVTPGVASRWSNRGAMVPIEAEIPITRTLPDRAIPIEPGQETPGQGLVGGEELLQARIFASAYRMTTGGAGFVYQKDPTLPDAVVLLDQDRDIELFRWRLNVAYERIAGSDFGTHIDVEYRTKANGARPTDHRLNELYVSYGLTDFRRDTSMNWGIAFGRLAIREAGYAQTDGVLVRGRLSPDLTLGVFGGVTGNPYGFNWASQKTQEFSADWIRGGAFVAYRRPRFTLNVATVATVALLEGEVFPGALVPGQTGLDRLYLYVDTSYLVTPTFNVFALGWIDVVGGSPIQNFELVGSYAPIKALDMRLSLGRFSTVLYDASAAYSFTIDQQANRATFGSPTAVEAPVVDENGAPVIPFDAVLGSAIYNTIRGRMGFRPIKGFEVFGGVDILLRDTSLINEAYRATVNNEISFASFRGTPNLGARYRNPELIDASLQFTYIADDQSNADAMIQGSVGRGYQGLYAQLDLRNYFGAIDGLDGGLDVTYTLPREWLPGRLMFRGQARYFREAIPLGRVQRPADVITSAPLQDPMVEASRVVIPSQESVLAFLSIEWRL